MSSVATIDADHRKKLLKYATGIMNYQHDYKKAELMTKLLRDTGAMLNGRKQAFINW